MSTFSGKHAGREWDFILSNKGLRVERHNQDGTHKEILRDWPDDTNAVPAHDHTEDPIIELGDPVNEDPIVDESDDPIEEPVVEDPTAEVPEEEQPDRPVIEDPEEDPLPTPSIPTGNVLRIAVGDRIPRSFGDDIATTIILEPGFHTNLEFYRAKPTSLVTITGEGRARASKIKLTECYNTTFTDMDVWPDVPTRGRLCLVQNDSININFENLNLKSVPDADNYMSWDEATWLANAASGIGFNRSKGSIINCHAVAVSSGYNANIIRDSSIKGFTHDALRGFNGCKIVNNYVQDCIRIPSSNNHDDMFQSFNLGDTPFFDMLIEGNTFVSWLGPMDHPLSGKVCQGIGMFDGMFINLTIRNNIVLTSHWHGISVYGMTDGIIEGNTVLNIQGAGDDKTGRPWIMIHAHKDGTPSTGNVAKDNVGNKFSFGTAETSGNTLVSVAETQARIDVLLAALPS